VRLGLRRLAREEENSARYETTAVNRIRQGNASGDLPAQGNHALDETVGK
jgi:hypothetical protein